MKMLTVEEVLKISIILLAGSLSPSLIGSRWLGGAETRCVVTICIKIYELPLSSITAEQLTDTAENERGPSEIPHCTGTLFYQRAGGREESGSKNCLH